MITQENTPYTADEIKAMVKTCEKYYKARERASKLRVQNPFDTVGQMVEHIFPELKKSENEQIRKDILCYFEHYAHDIKGADAQKWIDWLKKQKNTTDKEYVYRPLVGDTIEKAAGQAVKLDGKVVLAFNGAYIPVDNKTKDEIVTEYLNWVKKQGEQTRVELGQSGMTKTSDKELEPKFHPGDWVIDNFGNTYQIETATEIESEHIFGYTIVGGGYFNDNSDVRLWTIEDAKVGDVLVASDGSLFILSKVVDTAAFHYFSLCKNGSKEIGDGNHAWESVRGCHPATKEERELLYAEMKEAGWEWDAEKKELKQIKDNTLEMRGNQVVSEIVKNQKEIPGEFTKLVHENFWDLIKTEHKMLDADKVIEWFRVNWWDNHIGDPIDKFKKDFKL